MAKVGRKPWAPDDKTRRVVMQLASIGVQLSDIASIVEVSEPTLRKHCYLELERGHIQGRARNAKRLHEAAEKGNVTAMIWLDKTRFGITEPDATPKREIIEQTARTAHEGTEWERLLQ